MYPGTLAPLQPIPFKTHTHTRTYPWASPSPEPAPIVSYSVKHTPVNVTHNTNTAPQLWAADLDPTRTRGPHLTAPHRGCLRLPAGRRAWIPCSLLHPGPPTPSRPLPAGRCALMSLLSAPSRLTNQLSHIVVFAFRSRFKPPCRCAYLATLCDPYLAPIWPLSNYKPPLPVPERASPGPYPSPPEPISHVPLTPPRPCLTHTCKHVRTHI